MIGTINFKICKKLFILITALFTVQLSACQEQLLPDEVWQIVASHCHDSVGRCINRLFRDNILWIHIDHPIELNLGDSDDEGYKRQTDKREFLYRGLQQSRIDMRGEWILKKTRLTHFEKFLSHMFGQESLKLKIDLHKGKTSSMGYIQRLDCFLNNSEEFWELSTKCKELSIAYINAQFFTTQVLCVLNVLVKDCSLKKFSFSIDQFKIGKDFWVTPNHIQEFQSNIATNETLEEVTLTVERNTIRLRPLCEEDLRWFQFVCDVKRGVAKSKKAKAPWYWSGDPTKHT